MVGEHCARLLCASRSVALLHVLDNRKRRPQPHNRLKLAQ